MVLIKKPIATVQTYFQTNSKIQCTRCFYLFLVGNSPKLSTEIKIYKGNYFVILIKLIT